MKSSGGKSDLWLALLSPQRLFGQSFEVGEYDRSEFERDHDRVIFSSAFRRLQDKTQVFPLSTSDYTRNRMTHSLEVASAGRHLGLIAGKYLTNVGVRCEPYDVGTIVATAGLAHDIGNPPFGHSGEAAIQSWAKRRLSAISERTFGIKRATNLGARRRDASSIPMSREEVADFHYFGGNAQSLRILVRTAVRTRKGGMRPTLATIGTIAKYPRPSMMPGNETPVGVSQKKPGYFQNDSAMACRAFRLLGMHETAPGVFSRHPLAYLIEAADDACYAVADIEDAFRLGILTFDEVRDQLAPIAERDRGFTDHMYSSRLSRITRLRSCALAVMVRECGQVFRDSLDELEKGEMTETLMQRTTVSKDHEGLKKLAREKVYQNERVLLIEYAGYSTIGGLLDMFYAALCSPEDASRDEKLRRLLPLDLVWRAYSKRGRTSSSITEFDINLSLMTPYEKLLTVTDYVSGMTDRFAVHLYQRLSGIHLPG